MPTLLPPIPRIMWPWNFSSLTRARNYRTACPNCDLYSRCFRQPEYREHFAKHAIGSMQYVYDLKMSPSGKLLAVGGSDGRGEGGLQIFHFNGAQPITRYTGLLTNAEIDQFYWDNADHLYAISSHPGKLFVFTVTPTR